MLRRYRYGARGLKGELTAGGVYEREAEDVMDVWGKDASAVEIGGGVG